MRPEASEGAGERTGRLIVCLSVLQSVGGRGEKGKKDRWNSPRHRQQFRYLHCYRDIRKS